MSDALPTGAEPVNDKSGCPEAARPAEPELDSASNDSIDLEFR